MRSILILFILPFHFVIGPKGLKLVKNLIRGSSSRPLVKYEIEEIDALNIILNLIEDIKIIFLKEEQNNYLLEDDMEIFLNKIKENEEIYSKLINYENFINEYCESILEIKSIYRDIIEIRDTNKSTILCK
ncbi:hypothetical protein Mgra_00004284, partial [Meloidogyne graminicola]